MYIELSTHPSFASVITSYSLQKDFVEVVQKSTLSPLAVELIKEKNAEISELTNKLKVLVCAVQNADSLLRAGGSPSKVQEVVSVVFSFVLIPNYILCYSSFITRIRMYLSKHCTNHTNRLIQYNQNPRRGNFKHLCMWELFLSPLSLMSIVVQYINYLLCYCCVM